MSDVKTNTSSDSLGFGSRFALAFFLPWKIFFDGKLAARVGKVAQPSTPQLPAHDPLQLKLDEFEKLLTSTLEKAKVDKANHEKRLEDVDAALEKMKTALDASEKERAEQKEVLNKRNDPDGALHMLRIFQRDGRLIDFLSEDIAGFGDADIGAAARLVHVGCKKSLDEYFTLKRVRSEEEGVAITIDKGFDAQQIRLTGEVSGDGPFKGTLAHAGWMAAETKLPSLPPEQDPSIIAPAEVEL